jgi:uncharacterized membrane protein YfcA
MTIIYYLLICLIGILSGFIAGLLGIGGGILIIPSLFLLYGFFPHPHHEYLSQCILGTSNGIILLNSLKNFHNYYKNGFISIKNTLKFAGAGLIGGFTGGRIAVFIDSDKLKMAFGIFLIIMGIKMFFPKKEKSSVGDFNLKEYKMKTLPFLFIGFIVGFFSGIFGIGGGILAVPLLTMFTKVPMIFAQGFSVSLIPFNKIGGVFGYMVGGSKVIGVSLPFIGFIDLSLVLICGVLGGISTNIGLKLAKSINQFYLQKIFAVMLLIVALKIIW